MEELFAVDVLDFSDLDKFIHAEAPENGCTSALSGACCPIVEIK